MKRNYLKINDKDSTMYNNKTNPKDKEVQRKNHSKYTMYQVKRSKSKIKVYKQTLSEIIRKHKVTIFKITEEEKHIKIK